MRPSHSLVPSLAAIVIVAAVVCAPLAAGAGAAPGEESPGLQILTKVFRQYLKSQPEDLVLGDGVHLISTRSENDARANMDDGTFLGVIESYLRDHEVRIKLPELMPGEGFGRAFKTAMEEVDGQDGESEYIMSFFTSF
ncbi:unnamed protein product [Acanthoscelides obtectus]|uniref:Uncharacterized protein n=1 Tax=Acanthoscelides obtectus TaxID=200917 RepID=A0A9P0KHR3_ACAOB|nr:unnamed protein product [Acanthoscelides obtectus]CAK1648164.1 hypothetical protein AOBTE_LOCUS15577 [Acanthoscelides obtectus]